MYSNHKRTMSSWIYPALAGILVTSIGCGGATPATQAAQDTAGAAQAGAEDMYAKFGPLGVGADWASYTKVTTEPYPSQDHGNRFVETYVNDIGLASYKDDELDVPVGSVVVKVSWERDGDSPSSVRGPIFIMEKRDAGFDAENEDWYYAFHWADPPAKWSERLGGPVYWQSPSPKVNYCGNCHNGYDRQLGGVPEEVQDW